MIILIPITAILCAWIWFGVLRMPERYRWLQRKPFNCSICFSMWAAFGLYLCPVAIQEILFVTTTAAAVAAWLESI
jgi:hypothetical protein